jgi:hypothetical protein
MSSMIMKDLPKGYLSFSQVDSYLNCPKKYEWRYIINPPKIGGNPAMLLGSSGHEAIAEILEGKMNNKGISVANIIKSHHDDLNKKLKQLASELEVRLPITEALHQHDELLRTWTRDILPEFNPTSVESKVETTIGGYPFLMYIDAIHAGKRVFDWKFTGSAKNKYHLANSLQLSVYSIGTGLDEVGFGSLVKPKAGREASWKPKVSMLYTTRTNADRDWATKVVKSTAESIRKGLFPLCGPENFLCSDKYCDYYPICRGKEKTTQPSWLKEIVSPW